MIKKILISIALICLLVTISIITPNTNHHLLKASSTSFLTYQNTFYGVEMQYPSQWQETEFGNGGPVAVFIPPLFNDTGVQENVVIMAMQVVPSPNDESALKNYTDKQVSLYRSQYSNFDLIESGPGVASSGIPIYTLHYTYAIKGLSLDTLQAFAIRGHYLFRIVYNADTPQYSTFASIVDKMINTFGPTSTAKTESGPGIV